MTEQTTPEQQTPGMADPAAENAEIAAMTAALDLLEGDERAAWMRAKLAAPHLREAEEAWRSTFATLLTAEPEVREDAALKQRILANATLQIDAFEGQTADGDAVVTFRLPPQKKRSGLRFLGTVAASVALLTVGWLGAENFRQSPWGSQPSFMATLAPVGTAQLWQASVGASGRDVTVDAQTVTDHSGDYELWLVLGEDDIRSLGLLSKTGSTSIVLPEGMDGEKLGKAALAISAEPVGGSPTGSATGPVVALGALTEI